MFHETERAAAVVLDPNTFEILALASVPDFDPQLFVTGIDTETFSALNRHIRFQQPRGQWSLSAGVDFQSDHLHGVRGGGSSAAQRP